MNKNLIIIGRKEFGCIAKDTAITMRCFEKIDYLEDDMSDAFTKISKYEELVTKYSLAFVAIESPDERLKCIIKLQEVGYAIVSLVSPKAYIAPSAQIMQGSIVEPMAVIHSRSVVATGCRISSGAVINANSMCCDGVHVDCNAVVVSSTLVPAGYKVCSGEVYKNEALSVDDIFFNNENWKKKLAETTNKKPHGPIPINGREYCFEDGM